ncbi:ABC-2 transporter permease [Anaerocolumna aminovalerica]|uniref:ABC-2 transporter permease n=1 Tax=Anaerocolumna aminovalerica TaxID=1527 RepID=UPI001C0EC987|nr:ABC-2 transporter permease [Anaerocolumna aminovalerica]MBU5332482.1 ABC-2 transporter permease [Anaerocolumna aminovalerica]
MSGLVLKDILNLKRYMKQMGIILIVYLFMSINFKNPNLILFMMVFVTTMLIVTSMAYDESTKWDKYALTMPITKKDLVKSKYVLLILLALSGGVISLISAFILSRFIGVVDYEEMLLTGGGVVLASLLLFSLLLPIIFKMGTEKARIIMIILFTVPTILITGFSKIIKDLNMPQLTTEQIKYLGYASPFIVLFIVFLSYNLSVSIVNKKEF